MVLITRPAKNSQVVSGITASIWLSAIPYWFVTFAGLIYAAGFLIEVTFLHSMGIKEPALEAFKAKYIYIGLLAVQFPTLAGLLLLGTDYLKRSPHPSPVHWPTILIILDLLFAFYLLNTFTTPDFFASHALELGTLFVVGAFPFILIREIDEYKKRSKVSSLQPRYHKLQKFFSQAIKVGLTTIYNVCESMRPINIIRNLSTFYKRCSNKEKVIAVICVFTITVTSFAWFPLPLSVGLLLALICICLLALLGRVLFFIAVRVRRDPSVYIVLSAALALVVVLCFKGDYVSHRVLALIIIAPACLLSRNAKYRDLHAKYQSFGEEGQALRWILLSLITLWILFVFRDLWMLLIEMFCAGAWLYLMFMLITALLIRSILMLENRGMTLAISFCAPAAFIYLALLVFAYRVYPYIPIERGGGDYSTDNTCGFVVIKNDALVAGLDKILHKSADGKYSITVLDETTSALVVTDYIVPRDRRLWKRPGNESKPAHIVAIERESIVAVSSERLSSSILMGWGFWSYSNAANDVCLSQAIASANSASSP